MEILAKPEVARELEAGTACADGCLGSSFRYSQKAGWLCPLCTGWDLALVEIQILASACPPLRITYYKGKSRQCQFKGGMPVQSCEKMVYRS